jgi:hypothetical protein
MLANIIVSGNGNQVKPYSSPQKFILIGSPKTTSPVFGDILPFQRSRETIIDFTSSTASNLFKIITKTQIIAICVISFFVQIVDTVTYQTYVTIQNTAGYIDDLPSTYSRVKKRFFELAESMYHPQTRSLLWLELKLDARKIYNISLKIFGWLPKNSIYSRLSPPP